MRILLTNDDGYYAPGLKVLEDLAREFTDDIWVVAPHEEQSGAGHSLTLSRPLRVRKHAEQRYSVTGTPTDAVMLALAQIMKDAGPDVILSGVNPGANLAEDVTYSGTVSAAMEGALAGVRSIALSQTYARDGQHELFDATRGWGKRVLAPLLTAEWAPRTLVSVNFPPLPAEQVRGIKPVGQGLRDYGRLQIVTNRDPRGHEYHWFSLGPPIGTHAHSTDLEAIHDGYVSVTPLHLDLTHFESLATLSAAYA